MVKNLGLFHNSNRFLTLLLMVQLSEAFDASAAYKGCYQENPSFRQLAINPGFYSSTGVSCRKACSRLGTSASYAALSNGYYCFCSDSYGAYGSVASGCNVACTDGSTCGGNVSTSTSVYSLPTPMGAGSVTYNSSNSLGPLVFDLIAFQSWPNSSNFSTSYNFFDGTSASASTSLTYSSNYFMTPGAFEVTATVSDAESNVVTSSVVVRLAVQLGHVQLTCPTYATSKVQLRCSIEATGKSVVATLNFGDGDIRKDFTVGSSLISSVGLLSMPPNMSVAARLSNSVVDVTNTANAATLVSSQTVDALYLLVNQVINSNGSIRGWEFVAMSSGRIVLQVYRPTCSSGYQYCYRSDVCSPSCSNSSSSSSSADPWALSCNSSGLQYSIGIRSCLGGPNGQKTWLVASSYNRPNIQWVGETTVDIVAAGSQKVVLNDVSAIAVQQGDVIGVFMAQQQLAYQPMPLPYEAMLTPASTSGWATRSTLGYTLPILTGSSSINFNGSHSIVARVLRPAKIVLQKVYKAVNSANGSSLVFNVTQTMKGAYAPSSINTSAVMQVEDAVVNLTISAPKYGATNSSYNFTAVKLAGTSMQYTWALGDIKYANTTSSNASMLHTYTSAGDYTVTLIAFNDISSQQAEFNITIEDTILDLKLASDSVATCFGQQTHLSFSIAQGSSVVYGVTTKDGSTNQIAYLCPNGTMLPTQVIANYYGLGALYNYTFPLIGNWSVAVNASNHISWKSATIYVPVQIISSGLFINTPDVIPYLGNGTFSFYLINGSQVSFNSTFNGKPTRDWTVSAYKSQPSNIAYEGQVTLALKDYIATGNYVLTVSVWNLITGHTMDASATVWVDYILEDVATVPNTTFVRPGDAVSFNVTMSQGSRFTSVMSYGDNVTASSYRYEMLRGSWIEFVHQYSAAGNYTVVMNATNAVTSCSCDNNTLVMIVQNPVAGFHLATNSPVTIPRNGTGLAVLNISFDSSVLLATDAFILYEMGDVHKPYSNITHYLYVNSTAPAVDKYVYGTFGTYNVTLNVSNFVSYQYFTTVIDVDQEVLDLTIVSDKYLVVFNETLVKLTVTMAWGSRVNITWDWLDGTPVEAAGYLPLATNVKPHMYATVGVFYTMASTVNTVGNVSAQLAIPIIVQQPVRSFMLMPERAKALIGDPDWVYTMPFYLYLKRGVPLATNGTYVVDYGDGNISAHHDLTNDSNQYRQSSLDTADYTHVLTITHNYYVGVVYHINISIWNLVSSDWYNTSMTVYENVKGLHGNVTLLYKKDGATSNESATLRPGYGSNADFFPLDMILLVQTWILRGSFLYYSWNFGDGNGTALNYNISYTSYQYAEPGVYTIALMMYNDMINTNTSWTVNIQRRVGTVNITSSPAYPIQWVTRFSLYPGWIGTDACYYINFVDATSAGNYMNFVGTQATCTKYYSTLLQQGSTNRWMSAEEIAEYIAANGGNIEIDNIFNTNNMYYIKLAVINEVSSFSYTDKIAITKQYCLYPAVSVAAMNPCLTDVLCDNSRGFPIKKQYRGFKWYIDTSVVIDCWTTKVAFYSWQIYVVNETTGVETEYTGDKSIFQTASPKQLFIPPLSINYGLYRFELNVSMDVEIGLQSSDSMYVFIVTSPLVGGIVGGEFRRKGYGSNVTFDAISLTGDPDNPGNKTGFTCTWMCRRWCETWPVYDASYKRILINGTSTCPAITHVGIIDPTITHSTGGCFKFAGTTSAGVFPPDLYDPADPTGCSIMQDFWGAYEGEAIIMQVIATKGARSLTLVQTVDVAYGDPPEISAVCTANCADAVNYIAKLAYTSVIAVTHKGVEYVYSWRLLVNHNGSDYHNANPMPLDQWAPLNTTGISSLSIAIDAHTFKESDAVGKVFFLEVSAYRSDGNASNYGRNYKSFVINTPPLVGNCSVYPSNGTALTTQFNTKCDQGFVDKHVPLTYTIAYSLDYNESNPDTDSFKVLVSGVNSPSIPAPGSILSEGYEENDHIIYILIRCFDTIGSWSDLVVMTQVLPPPSSNLAALAEGLRSGTGSIQNLLAGGDSTQAFNFMGAVLSSLGNSIPEWNATAAWDTCLPEAFLANSTGELGNVTYDGYAEACLAKLYDGYLLKKHNSMSTKEGAMKSASSLPLTRTEDANHALSFLSTGTGKADELSGDAQDSTHAVMETSLTLMQNDELQGQLDPVTKVRMCKSAVLIMGDLMQATALSVKAENAEKLALNGTAAAALQSSRRRRSAGGTAADLQKNVNAMASGVADMLASSIVAGEAPTLLSTSNMAMAVEKAWPGKAAKKDLSGGGKMNLPSPNTYVGNSTDPIQSKIVVHKLNPFYGTNDTGAASPLTVNSNVVQLSLQNSSGGAMDVSNVTAPIHVVINRDASQISITTVVGVTTSADNSQKMTTYKVVVPAHSSLHLRVRQLFNDTSTAAKSSLYANGSTTRAPATSIATEVTWTVYVSANRPPSTSSYDYKCDLPYARDPVLQQLYDNVSMPIWASNLPTGLVYDLKTCFMSNSALNKSVESNYYVGIKYVVIPEPVSNSSTTSAPTTMTTTASPGTNSTRKVDSGPPLIMFEMEIYSSLCKYWNYYIDEWTTNGCEVGPYTSPEYTHCICYQLTPTIPAASNSTASTTDSGSTGRRRRSFSVGVSSQHPMSFGAAVHVPMNTINLSDSAFNHLDDNPLVFSVMVSLLCVYMSLIVWAKKKDMLDQLKAGSSPLLDNDPRDQYLYELVVYTGSRARAGTTSRVSMILSGESDETLPRLIYDDKRPVLQKSGIDAFVMATPRPLGPLTMLRVWHNNSGRRPGWFFSRMQVTDLQTGSKYYFILDRWLAVEEDDAAVDRVVPVAGKAEMTSFNHLFWTKARKDLTDGHIWFSVFGRPHMSRFTRCQRLTVCLTMLFSTMMANILFYKTDTSSPSSYSFTIGPITLGLNQILKGVYSSLMVLPGSLIVMQMFRKAGERPKTIVLPTLNTLFTFDDEENDAAVDQQQVESQGIEMVTSGAGAKNAKTKKKKKRRLPWWIIYVAYTISLGICGVSVWATVEVAGVFGPEKAQQWLISFIVSFIESVLLSQPIKVLVVAIFFGLFVKKPPAEGDGERDPALKRDETFLHQYSKGHDLCDPEYQRQFEQYREIPLPPTPEFVRAARLQREREMQMHEVMKEIVVYAIYLTLLMMVGYGNSDPWMNLHYQSISNTYSSGLNNPAFQPLPFTDQVMDITQVDKFEEVWMYLENTVLVSIYESPLYKKDTSPEWSKNFTSDLQNMLMGSPRLRQLRVREEACKMPIFKYQKRCLGSYGVLNEDKGSYLPSWLALNTSDPAQVAKSGPAWQYRASDELKAVLCSGAESVYGGGGYAIELGTNIRDAAAVIAELHATNWIDQRTRAVFIEFNLYNANLNLNTASFTLLEFLTAGNVVPTFNMKPFRLDRYTGSTLVPVLVSQLLLLVYVLYFQYKEAKLLKKLKAKYFEDPWNVYELVTLLACVAWLFLEIFRLAEARSLLSAYRENKMNYLSLQSAATFSEVIVDYCAILMFVATLKMTKLLRFNNRIMILMRTLTTMGRPVASFMAVCLIVFFAFANMCYMVFVTQLSGYSTFLRTCETLFGMMLNKFNFGELTRANPVMAPILFIGFVVCINFVMINFMMTLIMNTFSTVKEEAASKKNKYEIVEYMVNTFKAFIGLSQPPPVSKCSNEAFGFVGDTDAELSSRVEELLDRFVGVITSDPLQRSLLDAVEQRLKENKNDLQGLFATRRVIAA